MKQIVIRFKPIPGWDLPSQPTIVTLERISPTEILDITEPNENQTNIIKVVDASNRESFSTKEGINAISGVGIDFPGDALLLTTRLETDSDWSILSPNHQDLAIKVEFALDVTGAVKINRQYLIDSKPIESENPLNNSLSVSYNFLPGNQSYLNINFYDYEWDLSPLAANVGDFRIPCGDLNPGIPYTIDAVVFKKNGEAHCFLFFNGVYYKTKEVWLELDLGAISVAGTCKTSIDYPTIGDIDRFFSGIIKKAAIKSGAYNPITNWSFPITPVFRMNTNNGYAPTNNSSYWIRAGIYGGLLTDNNRVTFNGDPNKRIEIDDRGILKPDPYNNRIWFEIRIDPTQSQPNDATIFCRRPKIPIEESFFGHLLCCKLSPEGGLEFHTNYLILKSRIRLRSGSPVLKTSQIDDGSIHRIELIRTNGCLDRRLTAADEGNNALWLVVDGKIQDFWLGVGDDVWNSEISNSLPGSIWIGGLPLGVTTDGTSTGSAFFELFNFVIDNASPIPDTGFKHSGLIETDFAQSQYTHQLFDYAGHPYQLYGTYSLSRARITLQNNSMLVFTPRLNEWNFPNTGEDQDSWISTRFRFDRANTLNPGNPQYIFDSSIPDPNGGQFDLNNIVSLYLIHSPSPRLVINFGGSAITVTIPIFLDVTSDENLPFNYGYDIDIVFFTRQSGETCWIVFIGERFWIDGGFAALGYNKVNWNINKIALGNSLFTSNDFPQTGDYPAGIDGKIERFKWMRKSPIPNLFSNRSVGISSVIELLLHSGIQDNSSYARNITTVGNVTFSSSEGGRAVFNRSNGGGYLQVSTASELRLDTKDWEIEIHFSINPFVDGSPPDPYQTNAAIICRPSNGAIDSGQFLLTLNNPNYPGYLCFFTDFYVVGASYSLGMLPSLRTREPIMTSNGTGLTRVKIVRISRDTSFTTLMVVNDKIVDSSYFGISNTDPGTPIFIGSLPPGITSSGATGSGKIDGEISYLKISNKIPASGGGSV